MKKLSVTLLIAICTVTPLLGQSWQQSFGNIYNDYLYDVVNTFDGNAVVVGVQNYPNKVFIKKVNGQGATLWAKAFQFNTQIYASDYHIIQTADSGFLLCGLVAYAFGNKEDVSLIRTNAVGDIIWSRAIGGGGPLGLNACGKKLIQTNDGGFAITGYRRVAANQGDVFLLKVNSLGFAQWATSYGDIYNEEGNSLVQTSDNGYLIAGFTFSYGATYQNAYLLRTDSLGNIAWSAILAGATLSYAKDIAKCGSNSYIITGGTNTFGTGTVNDYDLFLMKINDNAMIDWSYVYGSNLLEVGNAITAVDDNKYLITGTTEGFGSGQKDVLLLESDSLGNVLSTQAFGGVSADNGNKAIVFDNNVLIVGETQSFSTGNNDAYLIYHDSLNTDTCNHIEGQLTQSIITWSPFSGSAIDTGFSYVSRNIAYTTIDTNVANTCVCQPPTAVIGMNTNGPCINYVSNSTWPGQWHWDFGNGDTSSLESGIYCYPVNGTYNVCLSVINSCGTDTICETVFAFGSMFETPGRIITVNARPNPFQVYADIGFDNKNNHTLGLKVFNALGEVVFSDPSINGSSYRFQRHQLPQGIYFLQLTDAAYEIGYCKLLVE